MVQTDQEFQQRIETCSERDLYFTIDFFGGFIWRMNHDMADGRIPLEDHPAIDKDVSRCRERSCIAVKQCSRFGVDPAVDKDNRPTDDYWKWYRWWDGWKKGLSAEEWDVFDTANSRGLTEEEERLYQPAGDWRGEVVTAG